MRYVLTVAVSSLALLLTGCAMGGAKPGGTESGASQTEAPSIATPADWAAIARPGASHRLLNAFVGKWATKISFWSVPDASAQESTGVSETKWILGNRFIQESFDGKAGGEPFEGLGITGYNNAKRRFETVWADSMNTTVAMSEGTYDPDSQIYSFEGSIYDPLAKEEKKNRSTIKFISTDKYVFTMLGHHPIRGDFKALEIEYVRQP